MLHHQADVHMLNSLVFFVREKHVEFSCCMAVHAQLDALWLEGIVCDQALQVDEGDLLHVQGVLWQCKVDVPR